METLKNNDQNKEQANFKCGCGRVHTVRGFTDTSRHQNDTSRHQNDTFCHQNDVAAVPDDNSLLAVAELFKVFGDFTRTKIISYLRTGEHRVDDIAKQIGMTKSAVSHQLRVLRQTKIVKHRKSGRGVFYSLDDAHIHSIYDLALAHVTEE